MWTAAGEGPLILDRPPKLVEISGGAFFHPGAPEINDPLPVLGRLPPSQTLAHDHRERVFERRVGADRDIGIAGTLKAVVEHRIEIARDAQHPARPDRLDARLLHGIEHRARGLCWRDEPPVQVFIVAG